MSNTAPNNEINDSPEAEEAQGQTDWSTLAVALPREIKRRFEDMADQKHLRPSVYGRLVLIEALERDEKAIARESRRTA